MATQAKVIDENLTRQLAAVDSALTSVRDDLPFLFAQNGGIENLNHRLHSLSAAMPGVRTLFVLNGEGKTVASNQAALVGQDFHERKYFEISKNNNDPDILHVSSPIKTVLGTYAIFVEKSIVDRKGKFAGLVAAALNPDYFRTLLSSVNYAPDMWTSLVHEDGELFVIMPEQPIAGERIGLGSETGEDRMFARRTVRPASLMADASLVIATTRNMSSLFVPWRHQAQIQGAWFSLLTLISCGALFLFQKRKYEAFRLAGIRERERAVAEVALRESEERYRTIFSSAKIPMLLLDPTDGAVIDANDAALDFYGYEADQLKRLHIWDLNVLSREDCLGAMAEAQADNASHIFFRHRLAGGEIRDVEVYVGPITIEGRQLVLPIIQDVTERRMAEKALKDRERDLAEAQRIAHLGSWVMDVGSQGLTWSDEMHRIFGVPRKAFGATYQEFISLVHQDDRATVGDAYLGSLLDGGQFDIEYRVIRRSDGELRWCHARCDHERNVQGQVVRSVGTVLDITREKRAEEELRKDREAIRTSELQMALSQQVGGTGSWLYSLATDAVQASANSLTLFGFPSEAGERPLGEFLACIAERDRVQKTFAEAIREGRAYEDEYVLNPANGSAPKVIHAIGRLEQDASGEPVSVLGFIQDITKIREIEEDLKRSNAELEQFAYVASHDLRQPLRMISSYLNIIEKKLGPLLTDELRTYFGFAVGGSKKMDRLITDLLEYSRLGKSLEAVPVSLAAAAADALVNLTVPIRESGADLTLADDLPGIMGEATELVRLFQNLIGNAIKYRSPDRAPKVQIGWRPQTGNHLVWVKDNGMGIAAENCERAFQIFQRLVPNDAHEGSGIGLAICKKIVEHSGGKIWIESAVGKGSTFFMTFPIRSKDFNSIDGT